MDRIRKALDLARQQREQNRDTVRPALEAVDNIGAATALPMPPAAIVYTQTKVFTPDARSLEASRIVTTPEDPAATAFRMLRTQITQRMDENHWRSIAVLSPSADDGKTTVAINLAISLAEDRRHTVLLVDCDLKRPGIASKLGIRPQHGIDDLLLGEATIEECLYHPEGFERLVVLPARGAMRNSSEVLAGPRGRALIADLRGRYPERILVFDLPPVLTADDALAFLPLVECGLVIVAERTTRRDDLLRCMELLRRTPIVGTVLNKASEVNGSYV